MARERHDGQIMVKHHFHFPAALSNKDNVTRYNGIVKALRWEKEKKVELSHPDLT